MAKVLLGKIFILISFKENFLLRQVPSSSRIDCAIQVNFNLDAVDKG